MRKRLHRRNAKLLRPSPAFTICRPLISSWWFEFNMTSFLRNHVWKHTVCAFCDFWAEKHFFSFFSATNGIKSIRVKLFRQIRTFARQISRKNYRRKEREKVKKNGVRPLEQFLIKCSQNNEAWNWSAKLKRDIYLAYLSCDKNDKNASMACEHRKNACLFIIGGKLSNYLSGRGGNYAFDAFSSQTFAKKKILKIIKKHLTKNLLKFEHFYYNLHYRINFIRKIYLTVWTALLLYLLRFLW